MNWRKLPPGRTQVVVLEQLDPSPAVTVALDADLRIGPRFRKVVLDLQLFNVGGKLIRRARHGDTVYISDVK